MGIEIGILLQTAGLLFAFMSGYLYGNNKGLEMVIEVEQRHLDFLRKLSMSKREEELNGIGE